VADTMDTHYERIMSDTRGVYRERRDILAGHLERAGFSFAMPRATFYFWIRTPAGEGSMEFCRYLLEECGVVAAPGVGFGEKGEGYFRLSITADTETVREAGRKMEALGARNTKG
ncbi:MAG: aminotransferase class I/II-fold pyridoxal phosphate-dependent enzyme, partial [Candidatus Krumholzibacteria bacterium]|nr:aminotransferase class I/II-fold pyridoxal phosphate-dependent enzyme [Candidatus Krumholzibacteria bacterium]